MTDPFTPLVRPGRRLPAGPGHQLFINRPSTPVVRSGRRLSAGPGHHSPVPGRLYVRPIATLLVVGLAMALMVGPGLVALLSMIWAGRPDEPKAFPFIPVDVMLLLGSGRIVLAMALAHSVIRAEETE
jgi:hypothetical protein